MGDCFVSFVSMGEWIGLFASMGNWLGLFAPVHDSFGLFAWMNNFYKTNAEDNREMIAETQRVAFPDNLIAVVDVSPYLSSRHKL